MWFQESPFVPTYAYRCTNCAHEFETFQKFSEDPLTECPECGSTIRRVFQPVGIVFKGSGWYINDSRKSSEPAESSKPKEEKSSEPKSDPAPAGASKTPETPAPAKVAAD
jgi:putative FmdB family regulatory protein